jgi:hypothetical protein
MIRLEYTLKLVLQERKNRITPKAQYSVLEKVSLNVLCKIPTSIVHVARSHRDVDYDQIG